MQKNIMGLWIATSTVCLIFAAAIAMIWVHETDTYSDSPQQLTSQSEVDEYIEASQKSGHEDSTEKYAIPVGFFIQSIKFETSSDVSLTGYIWHKYPLDYPDNFSKGFIFPEGVDSTNAIVREVFTGKRVALIG